LKITFIIQVIIILGVVIFVEDSINLCLEKNQFFKSFKIARSISKQNHVEYDNNQIIDTISIYTNTNKNLIDISWRAFLSDSDSIKYSLLNSFC